MATKKASKAVSTESPKKSVTKSSAKTTSKSPAGKKLPVAQAPSSKKVSFGPAKPAKKGAATKGIAKKLTPAVKAKSTKGIAPHPAAQPKASVKKPVKKTPSIATKLASKTPTKTEPKAEVKPTLHDVPKKARLNKSDLNHFKNELLAMRDRITGQSGSMRNAALQRNDEINPEEDGTDAFMRLQTLEQVSSQQQIITNIDEALRAIEKGSYGVCDMCGELINKPRLSVLPFAKNCIKCQSEMERPHRSVGRR